MTRKTRNQELFNEIQSMLFIGLAAFDYGGDKFTSSISWVEECYGPIVIRNQKCT